MNQASIKHHTTRPGSHPAHVNAANNTHAFSFNPILTSLCPHTPKPTYQIRHQDQQRKARRRVSHQNARKQQSDIRNLSNTHKLIFFWLHWRTMSSESRNLVLDGGDLTDRILV